MSEEINIGGAATTVDTRDEGATATETKTLAPVPSSESRGGFWWGTGRRKAAVARVRIRPAKNGKGNFLVNGKKVEQYFTELEHRADVNAPLKVTDSEGKFDVLVNATGGGYTGQAGALVLGLARALKEYDANTEDALRDHGLLTRDARAVERKKYGQPGARRRFQFSKR